MKIAMGNDHAAVEMKMEIIINSGQGIILIQIYLNKNQG